MSPKMRVLVGLVTTVVFCLAGASILSGGQVIGGVVLLGLGLFRGVMLVREAQYAFGAEE